MTTLFWSPVTPWEVVVRNFKGSEHKQLCLQGEKKRVYYLQAEEKIVTT